MSDQQGNSNIRDSSRILEGRILDGKALAAELQSGIKEEAAKFAAIAGRPPGLGVILVGDNPASRVYVSNKEKVARSCGLATFDSFLRADATRAEVATAIDAFNLNGSVDGILLQLPLPPHLDQEALLNHIDPSKDADGLHPLNQGLLIKGSSGLRPCTPLGVMALLDAKLGKGSSLKGKTALVIGRSVLVGKPMAFLLLERDATVFMGHSKTAGLPELSRQADILIAAVGVPGLVKKEWIKPGAIVIDVGINRGSDGKLCGDVAFEEVEPICGAITPVPGGVGPLTVTMLVSNTVKAARARHAKESEEQKISALR